MEEAQRHFTYSDFTLYYLRQLNRSEREEIRSHSRTCERCRELRKTVRRTVNEPVWWSPEAYGEALRREQAWKPQVEERESREAYAFEAAVREKSLAAAAADAKVVRFPAKVLIFAQAAAILILAVILWRPHVLNLPVADRPPLHLATHALAPGATLDALLTDPGVPQDWRVRAGELLVDGVVKQTSATVSSLAPLRTRLVVRGAPQTASPDPVPLSPFSEAVRDGRPTFRWRPVEGADSYRVFVRTGEGAPLWNEDAGKRTEFPWPAGRPPLQPGGRYSWQFAALVAGRYKASAWDSFTVLGESQQRDIAKLERDMRNSPLALAAVDESYGLYDDAAEQIRNLQARFPEDPRPTRMLDSLTALRKVSQ